MGAYGKSRRFRGIEAFAIRKRLKVAENVLRRQLLEKPNTSVLELGCGYYAANLQYLKTVFSSADFVGVDMDVDQSLTQHGFSLHKVDFERWHPQKTFDCVISLAVAEHMLNPLNHFKLIRTCLSENGIAIITTPTPASDIVLRLLASLRFFDKEAVSDHKLYLTYDGIKNMSQSADLELRDHRIISMGMNHVCTLTAANKRLE